MNRKGQSAIEYLMNYAWAIALIIIVGVAIFSLDIGGLRSSIQGSGSQLRASGQTISVNDWVWQDTNNDGEDTFILSVQNNGANKVELENVTAVEIDGTDISGDGFNSGDISATLFPGQDNNNIQIGLNGTVNGAVDLSTDDTYNLKVRITYNNTDTGILHNPEYTLSGTVENG